MPLSAAEIQHYYGRFFVLQEGFLRGALRVAPVGKVREPHALTRGERNARKPVRFRPDEGSKAIGPRRCDLGRADDRLSTRYRRARERAFSGWATYPVELEEDGVDADAYHGLAVHGRCGDIENSMTPKKMLPPPVPEGDAVPGRRGLLFEHGSWAGSDLFCPSEGTAIFVTRNVRDALISAKVKNLHFERATDVERIWD